MPVTAAVIGGAEAVGQAGLGLYQLYKAKQIAKNNIRPEYTPNEQILQNADLAASRANTGLSDASLALATQQNERNLSQILDAILRSGGGTNQISDLYANNSDTLLKLAALDNQLQGQNVNTFMNANAAKGGEYQSAWQINKYAPYADRAQLASNLQSNGFGNIGKGIQTGTNTASNYMIGNFYKGQNQQNGNQNFDVPLSMQQNPPDKYQYGNIYMNPNGPASNYLKTVLQSQYDQEAYAKLDKYHNNIIPFTD